MRRPCLRLIFTTAAFLAAAAAVRGQADFKALTDRTTYNVGSEVRLRIVSPSAASELARLRLTATVRYAGDSKPVADRVAVIAAPASPKSGSAPRGSGGATLLWRIPLGARTGRYEIDLHGRGASAVEAPKVTSFAVHRKLVRIERIDLDKSFYAPGDGVAPVISLRNLTGRPLSGLRVEFSTRYWPWIAQSSDRAGIDVTTVAESLALPSGGLKEIRAARAAVAADVKQPTVTQYAVVVWERERKDVLDIAFSPLVFVRPAGVEAPEPYAGTLGSAMQYLHPDLHSIDTSSYRHFYPADSDSSGIEFESGHTMFPSGGSADVHFAVHNPTAKPWRDVSIRARLVAPDGSETASSVVAEAVDLEPGAAPLKQAARFELPASASGLHRAEVVVSDAAGDALASNRLELAVNPLPRSVLIFCAHQDDEGAHSGIIRAAVENRVPLHFVYFTSADSGSCDRYYQRSCGPAEALNFGLVRMDETLAALGHLGVRREDIEFLGLPDGGSGQIWTNHIHPSAPYLSVLLASDHAPYEGLARPNLPYARDSVVQAAKELIKKYQPEVIYTGHPDERHVDHRTNNWFVVKALQELAREAALPQGLKLLVDQVYGPGPQAHAPYHYQNHTLAVSGEAMALAQEARWFYQSQDGNRAESHRREFEKLPRTEVHWLVLDWKEFEGWNEKN